MHLLIFLLVTGLLIALDLGSKYFFYNFQYGSHLPFLEPVLNTGISRGIAFHIPTVIIISILALLFFIWLYFTRQAQRYVVSLFVAGTIGNVTDRILLGGVRDFLYPVSWFPIFNIADILLSLAVCVFMYYEFFGGHRKQKA